MMNPAHFQAGMCPREVDYICISVLSYPARIRFDKVNIPYIILIMIMMMMTTRTMIMAVF